MSLGPTRDSRIARPGRFALGAVALGTLLAGGESVAAAQEERAVRDTATLAACTGQRVTAVEYLTQPPPLAGERVPAVVGRPVTA